MKYGASLRERFADYTKKAKISKTAIYRVINMKACSKRMVKSSWSWAVEKLSLHLRILPTLIYSEVIMIKDTYMAITYIVQV